ncbi:MAG TPA: hypothetical protein VFE55_14175 [Acidimicrobiia bacterium]|nr:hypothetical protein [Acidimicrobiia bacterium]
MVHSVRLRALLTVLTLTVAAAGCHSGGRPAAKGPAATLDPSGGGAAGGGSATGPGAPDAGSGPDARVTGPAGGPSGSAGAGGSPAGTGGSGGGAGGGSGPIVGAPTDPGAGPARPKGWRKLAAGPLRGRHGASAVWTGREMVVWGGAWRAGNASIWLDDGAAYDPAGDRWRPLARSPLAPRSDAVIAWTGHEVLIWGGQKQGSLEGFGDEYDDGALYDPARDTWKPMAIWPLASRYGARAVWTGTRLVVWGGASAEAGDQPPPLADGAAYDPGSNRWTKLAAAPLAGRIAPLGAARAGAALLSWGLGPFDGDRRAPVSDSAVYDPIGNRWSPAAAAPAPPKKTWCFDAPGCVGVDTGSRVVFAGQGLAWDPAGDRWTTVAPGPLADPALEGKASAWTGSRVMLWGGGTTRGPADTPPATVIPGGAAYDPAADRWDPLPAAPLAARARAAAVWTGRELIVWGGEGDEAHRAQFDDGAGFTP